jgi:hypothetical protein
MHYSRGYQRHIHQTNSQHLMETEWSFLHSQGNFIGTDPEADQFNAYHSSLCPSVFPTNNLYVFLFSPSLLHVLPISSSRLRHSKYIWQRVQVAESSSCSFVHTHDISSLFDPIILLRILVPNTTKHHRSVLLIAGPSCASVQYKRQY